MNRDDGAIRTPIDIFDYIYYRAYRFFTRLGDAIADWKAMHVVWMLQTLMVLDLHVIAKEAFRVEIMVTEAGAKLIFIAWMAVIYAFNYFRYRKKFGGNAYSLFRERWEGESRETRFRNRLAVIVMVFIIVALPVAVIAMKKSGFFD